MSVSLLWRVGLVLVCATGFTRCDFHEAGSVHSSGVPGHFYAAYGEVPQGTPCFDDQNGLFNGYGLRNYLFLDLGFDVIPRVHVLQADNSVYHSLGRSYGWWTYAAGMVATAFETVVSNFPPLIQNGGFANEVWLTGSKTWGTCTGATGRCHFLNINKGTVGGLYDIYSGYQDNATGRLCVNIWPSRQLSCDAASGQQGPEWCWLPAVLRAWWLP